MRPTVAYPGAGRSSLQKRCLAAATQPPALFVGYRIDRALQFGLPRAGVSAPPPLVSPFGFSPSSGGGTEPPRHSSGDGWRVELRRFFITFAAAWFAPVGRAAELSRQPRGPPPRVFRPAGAPAPLFGLPPATRESGCRYAPIFFRLPRWGWRRRLGALDAPPRPRRQGCARSRAPLPPRPLRPRPSSAWRALRDPPASVGRVRAAAATPIAYASLDMKCLGSPKKTATLRDSRSRPPRNPFFLGTLPATFHIEI